MSSASIATSTATLLEEITDTWFFYTVFKYDSAQDFVTGTLNIMFTEKVKLPARYHYNIILEQDSQNC